MSGRGRRHRRAGRWRGVLASGLSVVLACLLLSAVPAEARKHRPSLHGSDYAHPYKVKFAGLRVASYDPTASLGVVSGDTRLLALDVLVWHLEPDLVEVRVSADIRKSGLMLCGVRASINGHAWRDPNPRAASHLEDYPSEPRIDYIEALARRVRGRVGSSVRNPFVVSYDFGRGRSAGNHSAITLRTKQKVTGTVPGVSGWPVTYDWDWRPKRPGVSICRAVIRTPGSAELVFSDPAGGHYHAAFEYAFNDALQDAYLIITAARNC